MSRAGEPGGSASLSLVERVGRRGFMGKLALGAMGLATALAGVPMTAQAAPATISYGCCNLCHHPTKCSGRCCWTWLCCTPNRPGTTALSCKECYNANSCGPTCPSLCSEAGSTHIRCP